jgi:hypothetical protein
VAAIAFLLGARAGLKVSAERLFRLSILVQAALVVLGIGAAVSTVISGQASWATFLPLVTLGIHIYHFVIICDAIVDRREYPWKRLKWTFLFATIAYCAPSVMQLVPVVQARFSVGSMLLALSMALPFWLQIALLWWPRTTQVAPDEREV